MTDDEEKQLKQELLAVKLSLRRKQEFWETPRNIAILVGVTAAIAAAIGYWLGRASPALSPNISPAANGSLDRMSGGQFIDAIQTSGIVVIAAMVVYVVIRLDRTLTMAAGKLKEALAVQQALHERIARVWQRVDSIEQQSDRAVLGEWVGRAWQHTEKVEARLEALEKDEPPPPGTRPTDPPLGSSSP